MFREPPGSDGKGEDVPVITDVDGDGSDRPLSAALANSRRCVSPCRRRGSRCATGVARAFIGDSNSSGATSTVIVTDTGSTVAGVDVSITTAVTPSVLARELGLVTLTR